MMGSNSHGQLGIGEQCLEGFLNVNSQCAPAPCLVDTLRDVKVSSVECGSQYTMALVQGQNLNILYAWGLNEHGQLGLTADSNNPQCCEPLPSRLTAFEDQGVNIVSVSCGNEHTLFVSDQGWVYGCGNNGQGQLGLTTENGLLKTPLKIESLDKIRVVQAAAGFAHSLFLSERGEVYATGCNQKYQLGSPELINGTSKPIQVQQLAK